MYQSFERKYHPTSLQEVVWVDGHVKSIVEAHAQGNIGGHLILHGPNGTGKSTCARFIIDELVAAQGYPADKAMYEEMTGADVVSDPIAAVGKIWGMYNFRRAFAPDRLLLLIEELNGTHKHMNTFWLTLDAISDTAKVIVTTNNYMLIDQSIRSRFNSLHVDALSADQFLPTAMRILAAEGYPNCPQAAVLQELELWGNPPDNRKYYQALEAIKAKLMAGWTFPGMPVAAPVLKVVNGKK